jgi:hypothetical protein
VVVSKLNLIQKQESDLSPNFTQKVKGLVQKLHDDSEVRDSLNYDFQKMKVEG